MTTKIRRGRDPEQNETIFAGTNAKSWIGLHGQLAMRVDPDTNEPTGIVMSDSTTPGGFVIELQKATSVKANLPVSYGVTLTDVAIASAAEYSIAHALGYYPMVQVFSVAAGVYTDITAKLTYKFSNSNTLVIVNSSGAAISGATVILR